MAPLRTFTSTSGLQHLDLQSPPQSQESTPYFERSHTSILKAFDGAADNASTGTSSSNSGATGSGVGSFIAGISSGFGNDQGTGNGNGSGSGSGSGGVVGTGTGMGGGIPVIGPASREQQIVNTASNNGGGGGNVLPWMTKRSLEEQHQIQEKLVDKEFTSREFTRFFSLSFLLPPLVSCTRDEKIYRMMDHQKFN